MPLTLKQRRFIDAYLGEANGNATKAARLVGYADPNTQGPRLLVNVGIREEIDRRYQENCLQPNEVLHRLADQARGVGDFVRAGKKSGPSVDLKALLAAGKGHLIKCIRQTQHGTTIEFYDAQTALIHIGRHYELFTDKQKTEGRYELIYDDLDEDELDRRIAEAQGREAPAAGPQKSG